MARRPSRYDSFPTGDPQRYSRASYRRGETSDSGDSRNGTAADAYSRRATRDAYTKQRATKSRKRKIIVGVLCAVLVLVVGAGVAAAAYLGIIDSKLREGVDDDLLGQLQVTEKSEPFYALLMGVDRSEERADSGEYGDSFRSDSIILARIDPKQTKVTLISIMRDTYVDMGEYGYQKINAARAFGGPAYAVEVVSEFAGVPISHYAEIDFDGFRAAVDSLGGVEVDVPREINDDMAGGYVAAGPQTLNGDQALILCRSRYAYNDQGDGDTYRAANQRMIIGAVAKKLLASDPATMAGTVSAMADYITTDMGVDEIVGIALQMKDMNPDSDIYSCMNPTVSSYENSLWIEYSNNQAWAAMMERVDQGLSPTVNAEASANVGGVNGAWDKEFIAQSTFGDLGGGVEGGGSGVAVRNGNGGAGLASAASSALTNAGYDVTETGDADSWDYDRTLIIYNVGADANEARAIGETLGLGTVQENDGTYTFEGDYLVILGADYQG